MTNSNQNELQATLEKILATASEDYYIDYYLVNFKPAKGVNLSDRYKIIDNTMKKYKEHHKDFQDTKLKPIIEYFHHISYKDEVIHFEDVFIYKELYKILFIIDCTLNAQLLLNDSKAFPTGFAKVQGATKKVETFRTHNKKNIIGDYRLPSRGHSRFRYWFSTLYIKNEILAKFFTHIFLTSDFVRVKDFHEDEDASKLLLIELEFILMQQTTISKVIKSFGILLYWEMIKYLHIHKNDAESYTSNIIHLLFKEDFNTFELHKVIEIKSSLGFFPVFGASKKSSLGSAEKQFLHNKIFKQIQKDTSITVKEFEPFFESYIKTPHIQFLHKYPVELFRLNPKYSS